MTELNLTLREVAKQYAEILISHGFGGDHDVDQLSRHTEPLALGFIQQLETHTEKGATPFTIIRNPTTGEATEVVPLIPERPITDQQHDRIIKAEQAGQLPPAVLGFISPDKNQAHILEIFPQNDGSLADTLFNPQNFQ
jgi:hypothetical protein